jgi:hypothetical protein
MAGKSPLFGSGTTDAEKTREGSRRGSGEGARAPERAISTIRERKEVGNMPTYVMMTRLAPDAETATKVSLLVRSFGHATTETWIATPWKRFVELATKLT